MTEVSTYPQSHHFEISFHRSLAPASVSRTPVMPHQPLRHMASSADGYYSSPPLARQPSNARASSVSSTSSSTNSYSTSFSTPHSLHGADSRSLSPASGMSDPACGTLIASRSHYPEHVHEQSHVPQHQTTSLIPNPLQYLHSQAPPPLPLYSPVPTQRHFSRSTPYGYPFAPMPQHPPPLSFHGYHSVHSMYPSFSTTPYHSSPALPPYQTQQVANRSMPTRPETPKEESLFMRFLQNLPPNVIFQLQRHVGWFHCWKLARVNHWCREHFHPDRLPEEDKIAGLLYAEQNWGRYDEKPSSVAVAGPRKNGKTRDPTWFGCYHCFTPREAHFFELTTWNHSSQDNNDSEEEATSSAPQSQSPPPLPPSSQAVSTTLTILPPNPQSNPHYWPGLTRSSLAASASRATRRASSTSSTDGSTTSSSGNPASSSRPSFRAQKTWGQRRFCIECGVRKRFYEPGDVIELQKPLKPNDAMWVCKCMRLHSRPQDVRCLDCGMHVPLSRPGRKRR